MSEPRLVASFPALGTTAALALTGPAADDLAESILRDHLERLDLACSRFRDDSELSRLNAVAGSGPVPVSVLMLDAVDAALRAAMLTGGRVDPTVGTALEMIGYDRDFGLIPADGPALSFTARPVPGWEAVTIDRHASTVALRPGVRLDLGATAKAFCADQAAVAISAATGAGVLVSLGGDIAVAGPPPQYGWPVKIGSDHAAPLDGPGPVLALTGGGLATSSTTVRRWLRGGVPVHHLVDPATSAPVREHWQTVSVAAGTCLDANTASCAAVVMGPAAPDWLAERGLPARLVSARGEVTTVAGWPQEVAACC
ncbi:MAG TPA: FAD:protein FMN transferase [Acidimicrobiales bacterium]|nr:FAD:protein FMN transferase [Acidimicrobiales bacterium]